VTALLAIGLFNLAFLFWGDILILYALLGMTLPAFKRFTDRGLVGTGLALVLLPPLAMAGFEFATGAPFPNLAGLDPETAAGVMSASAPVYRNGSFAPS
jgi:uncharacterized protein